MDVEELRLILLNFDMRIGISRKVWDDARSNNIPSSDKIIAHYGSWTKFVRKCGLLPSSHRKSIRRSSKISAFSHYQKRLKALSDECTAPTADQWDTQRHRNEYNADSLCRILDVGWPEIVTMCGLTPAPRGIPEDYIYTK